ncbi:glycoside hydrolase family 72 [Niveomyces insectorum RCEF 264]|uniref:Glycoside hydrolase family 72 n=1 Tax=Niveomyces insectorum RCEF 264 TaxID=1081102 RepID=A0A167Z7P8_9HYPO|nr:glycoside hydrolase family 72 [Niveomyces insectorum RCEF 264]
MELGRSQGDIELYERGSRNHAAAVSFLASRAAVDDDDDDDDENIPAASRPNMALRADEQPLLVGEDSSDAAHIRDAGEEGGTESDGEPLKDGREQGAAAAAPGLFIWLLTLSAGLSGLLFGYDTGVISATLVSIGSSLSGRPLTSLDKSVITAATALLALVASPAASVLADARGRRRVILAADALFVAVLMLGLLPESPRWLVQAGRVAEARAVLARVQGQAATTTTTTTSTTTTTTTTTAAATAAASAVSAILHTIEAEVRAEREAQRLREQHHRAPTTWYWPAWAGRDAWATMMAERRNKRALAIACLLQGLQQLCGFNSLMYFSATIFMLVGFDQPTLTALTVAATNFVFTVAALLLVDRIGRRRVLLGSIPVMTVGLVLAAYGFSFLDLSMGLGDGTANKNNSDHQQAAGLVLASIMLYVAAYAIGLGNVPWMQSELFALDVRALGSGLATATNWLANFVVGITFLPLMEALTPSWTFVLYAGVCAGGFVLVRACFPETSGLSLEAAARLLERDDWGVGSSRNRQNRRSRPLPA